MQKRQRFILLFAILTIALFSLPMAISADETGNDFSRFTSYSDESICIAQMSDLDLAPGETFIKTGEAIGQNDIVIFNNTMAIAIGAETRDPWGYPAGSVLDVARVYLEDGTNGDLKTAYSNGKISTDYDRVWDIQFLMNNWDSWAPNNAGVVTYEVVRFDFDNNQEYALDSDQGLPTLKLAKKYTVKGDFDVITYYSMSPDADYAYMTTYAKNNSSQSVENIKSGYSLTHEGDFDDCTYSAGQSDVASLPYHHFTTAYTENTAVTLAVPNQVTQIGTSATSGYQDLYCTSTFAPNDSKYYNGRIIMDNHGDIDRVIDFLMDQEGLTDDNKVQISGETNVSEPVVVVKKTYGPETTKTFTWKVGDAEGAYDITLPSLGTGESYSVFVEKEGYAASSPQVITANDFNDNICTLEDFQLEKKVPVTFHITDLKGNPIYGKVIVDNEYPTVRYTGDATFLTETKGIVETSISPGDYSATVYGEGYNFYCLPKEITGNTAKDYVSVGINMKFTLDNTDWLSADVHHHSNKNDGYSSADTVVLSQLAAGLDVAVISDHDFTSENKTAYDFIKENDYDINFYPSVEISCSWAHFNVLPQNERAYELLLKGAVRFDQFADYNDIVNAVHDLGKTENDGDDYIGATITQNHPYITYGLAYADKYGVIPGKYDENGDISPDFDYDAYDTVEINGATLAYGLLVDAHYNNQVYDDAMNDWTKHLHNKIKAHYLVGGSDVHDVLMTYKTFYSGVTRTVAFAEGSSDMDTIEAGLAFTNAANSGNSYITCGPLLFPDKMFGEQYETEKDFTISIDAKSITGIKTVQLYGNDGETYKLLDTVELKDAPAEYTYKYTDSLDKGDYNWYSVKVTAADGKYAISNPYWVKQVTPQGLPYYKDSEDKDVFIGFAIDAENYIETTGKTVLFKENPKSFSDVNQHWAKDAIDFVAEREIFIGTDNNKFSPDNGMTRAMFVTVIGRLYERSYGLDISDAEKNFKDVKYDSWYGPYVQWAAQNDIVKGVSSDSFEPTKLINRQEMATLLYRFSEYMKAASTPTGQLKYPDSDKIADWAQEGALYCQNTELIIGDEKGNFAPVKTATRAEASTVLERYIKLIVK
ncbi:MAG: CehA/McbA family metallohydrolase [Bacillota bacterium]|nr:CehA/McbA family metallohydrolase [Bacillota bacterium]